MARLGSSVGTVIVTGASGFIGKVLVARLKSLRFEVVEFNHSDGDIADPIFFVLPMYLYEKNVQGCEKCIIFMCDATESWYKNDCDIFPYGVAIYEG